MFRKPVMMILLSMMHLRSPIRYIFGSVNQNDLAAFYRDADVALITPLRDGMNLVAKVSILTSPFESASKVRPFLPMKAKFSSKRSSFLVQFRLKCAEND